MIAIRDNAGALEGLVQTRKRLGGLVEVTPDEPPDIDMSDVRQVTVQSVWFLPLDSSARQAKAGVGAQLTLA